MHPAPRGPSFHTVLRVLDSARTGIAGRGLLGKWGPNQAADPIVTRWHPDCEGTLQMVAIERTVPAGVWAIPGGMVDDGEARGSSAADLGGRSRHHYGITSAGRWCRRRCAASLARRRGASPMSQRSRRDEQTAHAMQAGSRGNACLDTLNARESTSAACAQAYFNGLIDALFTTGKVVYRGYVDDPRNTDNAWMETTAFHFHVTDELGAMLPLKAGDDARKVRHPLDVAMALRACCCVSNPRMPLCTGVLAHMRRLRATVQELVRRP